MIFEETCPKSVYERVRHQNTKKRHGEHPIGENKVTLLKMSLFNHFGLISFLNAKTHAKHSLRERE